MIKNLYLKNFRNYHELNIDFSPTMNMICGENAQGKTNLLEALFLFVTGRSFRTTHLTELIRFDTHSFYLQVLIEKNGIEQVLKFSYDGNERKIIYNATSLVSLSSLIGVINGVILSPEDRSLIKGGPALRRQFLDILISQANPLYLFHLSRYLRAMKQRNFLLKKRSLATLSIWEEHMATAAAFLTYIRYKTTHDLKILIQSETLGFDQIDLVYRSQSTKVEMGIENLKSFFLEQFSKNRSRECDLGISLSGPHRDDLIILIHGKEARQFASEGQQRSCTASLKLAQWKWLNASADQKPILFIDDLGVSFDGSREKELFQRVEGLGQVFITSARPASSNCHLIRVENGQALCKIYS